MGNAKILGVFPDSHRAAFGFLERVANLNARDVKSREYQLPLVSVHSPSHETAT